MTDFSSALSVSASDADGDDASLIYQWSVLTKPGGAADPVFSPNGGNSAASSTVTFQQAGIYDLRVTVSDADGLSASSDVTVTVEQTAASVEIAP